MKLLSTLLLVSSLSCAQDITQMDQNQMQAMMQEMQKMQACMSKIDFSEFESLQTEATIIETELKKLCQAGKRDQAQNKAVAYAHKVMKMPALIQMQECSKNSAMAELMKINIDDFQTRHVCDDEKIELGVPSNQRISW